MSDYIMPAIGFEPCPDPWAQGHVFYNRITGKTIPARCKRWTCYACAKINYYKVDWLLSAGLPERFITLTRAGNSPQEIRTNLQHLVQGLRRLGLKFEYAAVAELHENGQAHLHILQRGDFIEQELLSEMWERYTAKSYQGAGSFIVDIRKIQDNQNIKGYLLKYLKKSWDTENHDNKSWEALQRRYSGLNHYRMSRNWLPKEVKEEEKESDWELMPLLGMPKDRTPLDPMLENLFQDEPDYRERAAIKLVQLTRKPDAVKGLGVNGVVECTHSIVGTPTTIDTETSSQLSFRLVDIVQPTPIKKRGLK